MPRMVAVEIDSIRMFYPSCLICVTLDEDGLCHSVNNPNDILPNLTPSELIGTSFFLVLSWEIFILVQEAHAPLPMNPMPSQVLPPRIVISKRNKLLTAGLRSLPHTNAVLASTFLGWVRLVHLQESKLFNFKNSISKSRTSDTSIRDESQRRRVQAWVFYFWKVIRIL